MKNQIYDVIIIGAGPAGVAASNYCFRKGLNTLLIYKNFGGQINYTHKIHSIPGSPAISSNDLIEKYFETVKNVKKIRDIVLHIQKIQGIFYVDTKHYKLKSKTVLIATGASPKKILNEIALENILTYENFPYKNLNDRDTVLVIGGGYSGIDFANYVYEKVQEVIIIEKNGTLGANECRRKELSLKNNITIFTNVKSSKINFSENALSFIANKNKITRTYSKLFLAIGPIPNTSFLQRDLLNKKNEVKIYSSNKISSEVYMSTITSGLFAAGDVAGVKIKGIANIAEGMGTTVAISIFNYLKNK